MKEIDVFHSILFAKHRPTKNREVKQAKFGVMLKELVAVHYLVQPIFEVDFFKPHSLKTKYYTKFIDNNSIAYFNNVCKSVDNEKDEDVKLYWLNNSLKVELVQIFTELHNEIKRLGFDLELIDPSKQRKHTSAELTEDIYVYQYLKVKLISLYLNIQDRYKEYLDTVDLYEEDDIYLSFFQETTPLTSFIKESEPIDIPIEVDKEFVKKGFLPYRGDLKPTNLKVNYENIINQDAFALVEEKLYEYEIIDINYKFIKHKGRSNNSLLAAVYKVLIDCNYFRMIVFGKNETVKDIDIRKYLDERYSVDTSQQFRRLKPENINKAKNKLYWLDKITPIR